MNDRLKYLLTIEDAGAADEPPAVIRLRRLLKNMLREHSFRCTEARLLVPTRAWAGEPDPELGSPGFPKKGAR